MEADSVTKLALLEFGIVVERDKKRLRVVEKKLF